MAVRQTLTEESEGENVRGEGCDRDSVMREVEGETVGREHREGNLGEKTWREKLWGRMK